jgi:hypothetical protein
VGAKTRMKSMTPCLWYDSSFEIYLNSCLNFYFAVHVSTLKFDGNFLFPSVMFSYILKLYPFVDTFMVFNFP